MRVRLATGVGVRTKIRGLGTVRRKRRALETCADGVCCIIGSVANATNRLGPLQSHSTSALPCSAQEETGKPTLRRMGPLSLPPASATCIICLVSECLGGWIKASRRTLIEMVSSLFDSGRCCCLVIDQKEQSQPPFCGVIYALHCRRHRQGKGFLDFSYG